MSLFSSIRAKTFSELALLFPKSWQTYATLLKFMIPISIIVKVLNDFGLIEQIASFFEPIMQIIGLPGVFALVFISAIICNIFAAMIAFLAIYEPNLYTALEVNQLWLMVLIAHNLPIEISVAHRAGVFFMRALVLRLAVAFLAGYLLHLICSFFDLLSNYATMEWTNNTNEVASVNLDWKSWFINEVRNYFAIFWIIFCVMIFLRITEIFNLQQLIEKYGSNFLSKIGISPKAIPIVIVGMCIGMAYGGGLIIKKADENKMSKQDVFFSITLLCLFHAFIEDTILILLMGANIYVALFYRLFISLLVVICIFKLNSWLSKKQYLGLYKFIFGYLPQENNLSKN